MSTWVVRLRSSDGGVFDILMSGLTEDEARTAGERLAAERVFPTAIEFVEPVATSEMSSLTGVVTPLS